MAIVALLEEPTVTAAAQRVGVGEATLWRWQQDAGFQQAFTDARQSLLDQALSDLRRAGSEAVAALVRNLDCGVPGTEVKAASELLSWFFKGAELLEVETRLRILEGRRGA